jgi:hypothetical protein
MPVLTDNFRQADVDNPNGYYEFEAVKHLSQDTSWLVEAYGKAVKMVYRLLRDLPREHPYRVVMMHRQIDEIVASQEAMLQHRRKDKGTDRVHLAKLLQMDLDNLQQWMQSRPHFRTLDLNYNSIIADPETGAVELNRFLGGRLDIRAMSEVVDPTLYRQRQL